jgi:Kef-type K+ transport system membrane component KefB
MHNLHLGTQFFLQLVVILTCCRIVGLLAAKCGQPQVVAQMIAGVLLGPSFLGLLAPEWKEWLFPWDPTQTSRDTQSYLFPISQFGLALYMFIVGMEFRVDVLRQHWKASAAVSLAGMIAPFALGGTLGWFCQRHTRLFSPETSATEAVLFLGASMCITAFPMLARIIHFKSLIGSRMGTVAIGAGAIGDVAAWCLLAVVVASFKNQVQDAAIKIAGGAVFVITVTMVIRPLLRKLEWLFVDDGRLCERGLVLAVALMALAAWVTDTLGFHVVFGAFVMGAAMPRGVVVRGFVARVEPFTVAVLLPLFFTYSGLNTQMGLLATMDLALVVLAVLIAAIIGKWGACYLAARWSGIAHREALGIGALMNARGLMELIIIDIGLEHGVITPGLFSALMVMAIVTTLMTSPLFDWLVVVRGRAESTAAIDPAIGSAIDRAERAVSPIER